MTVRFLTSWNGYYAGQVVTSPSGSTEAALVAANIASYALDGPDPDEGGLVRLSSDGTALVSGDGTAVVVVGRSQEFMPASLPWLSARGNGTYETVALPSPYSPGHVLHPSVVYIPNGWNGYTYWCAYTPYPDSNAEFENPCVAASNDGNTWVAKGVQPLVESPAGAAFNSDTDLYYDESGNRLVLLYRDAGAPLSSNSRLRVMTSSDGATWTAPTVIYTSTGLATAAATDIASPSIWYNSTSSKWEIVGHNVKDSGSAWPFVKITSDNLLTGWDTSLTTLTFVAPSGRKWWHSEFRRLSSGAIVGMAQDNAGTLGSSGNMYSAYSEDGSTFSYSAVDVGAPVGWYRPSFAVRRDVLANEWVIDLYGSKLTTSGLFRGKLRMDKGSEIYGVPSQRAPMLAAAAIPQRNLVVADTFTRADDATTLGTATSGAAYTAISGPTNVLGIIGNKCYNVTTSNCRSTIDAGTPDHISSIRIDTKSAEMYMMVRYVDSSNFIRVGVSSSAGQLKFNRVTGGTLAVDTALGVTPVNGDDVTVRCVGGQISVFLNDVLISTVTDTQGLTATLVGIQMAGTLGGRLDNYLVMKV